MADRAKHAFGALERVDESIANGTLDSFDVLFVKDANGKPYVGWVDKEGNKVIVDNETDLSGVEAELATKANIAEVEALESELATKANVEDVNAKIDAATADTVASANAYTDGKVEAAINEHMVKKYEITSVPDGTLVDYRDKEIRVMCPVDTKWVKQNVGSSGNANMYYMGFKAYAPQGAVSFKEGDRGVIIDEMFDFNGDFAGTDEYGRNYSICWLALASYDAGSDTWTYFGKNSSESKYIGWDYIVEWYNADGIVIASDCVRINLSNENCHSSTKPYYVGVMMKDIETMVDERVSEINSVYEVIEF
jgi:hypothetical protein